MRLRFQLLDFYIIYMLKAKDFIQSKEKKE